MGIEEEADKVLVTVNSYVLLATGQDLTLEDDYQDFRSAIVLDLMDESDEDDGRAG